MSYCVCVCVRVTGQAVNCNVTWGRVCAKAVYITYCECVSVALGIQHAMRMRLIAICGPALLCIISPHDLMNGTIPKGKLLNITVGFRFSLQLLSETFLILRRIQPDITINAH